MVFTSLHYLIFFPLVVSFYFSLPHKYRWLLLLLASYYFYMSWKPFYVVLIGFTTLVNYAAGISLGKLSHSQCKNAEQYRKLILAAAITATLSILFFFKYFNFFTLSTSQIFKYFNLFKTLPTLKVLLPVGISFYTFQSLSYTIDVYRKKQLS